MGPTLAPDRDSTSAPTVAGLTPGGDAQAVAPASDGALTLLAFLSTGCASCAGFWEAFRQPGQLGLPTGTRLVVVTKGPDREIPGEVAALAAPGLLVLMSSDAWTDYEVPGSPFFVLVDGTAGRRIGEGVANHFSQVAELVRRAEVDTAAFAVRTRARSRRRHRRTGPGVGQRPGTPRRGHPPGRPQSVPDVAGGPVRAARCPHAVGSPARPPGGLSVATLLAHGISAGLPAGFEGRIFKRQGSGVEVANAVAQFLHHRPAQRRR